MSQPHSPGTELGGADWSQSDLSMPPAVMICKSDAAHVTHEPVTYAAPSSDKTQQGTQDEDG